MKLSKISVLYFLFFLGFTSLHSDVWTTSRITSPTVWTRDNSTGDGIWVVNTPNDTLFVESNASLTIEPGVTVKFHDDVVFHVFGSLVAAGTEQDSIRFTMDDAAGSAAEWNGIKLLSLPGKVNIISYCRIEKGNANFNDPWGGAYVRNGGAIYCESNITSSTIISHNVLQNNRANDGGGAIYCAGSPLIEKNIIRNNTATQYGGGIGLRGVSSSSLAQPVIQNNIISNNTANAQGGGGVGALANCNTSLYNNLIYNNSAASGSGGGLLAFNVSCQVALTNSVLWGNIALNNPQIGGTVNATYSDVQDGYSGTGNISTDPQFDDASGYDFHFQATSPLVDSGTNTNAPTTDFDNNARPFDGDRNSVAIADMGPFEYLNTAPEITSAAVTSATEDMPYSYEVTASDPDAAESLTYSLTEAPSFLGIDAETGLITGTATSNSQAGEHAVTVQVADLNGATDTQSFTLTVTAVNDAPVVSEIPDQTINEGSTFSTVVLDDYVSDDESPDTDMQWTFSGNTDLSVSITNRIATISAPDQDWFGSESITFTATDPGNLMNSTSTVFTINSINDAPVAGNIPGQTIAEGQLFASINLDNYVNDIDNAKSELVWNASGHSSLNVVIDANRVATISAPDENWFGNETITFTVNDPGNLSDTDTAHFVITAVNDAPVVSDIPDQAINEGQNFTAIQLDEWVSDVDNSDIQLTWSYSGNQDLSVTISPEHQASITIPDADWFGSETITFRAADPSGAFNENNVVFTVNNVNDAPVAVDDQADTSEDTAFLIDVTGNDTDVEGDDLHVIAFSQPAYGSTAIETDGRVLYTPSANWNGIDSFTYTVSDGNGGEDQGNVQVTVSAVNDTPVATDLPDQTIDEGSGFAVIDLDNYVSDVDNSDAQLTWSYSGNQELSISVSSEHNLSVTVPAENWFGAETITFRVTDPSGAFDEFSTLFTVNNVNDAPVALDDEAETSEDAALHIDVTGNDTDVENDDLHASAVSQPAHGSTSIGTDGRILYTPSADWNGSDSFTYTVSDGNGGEDQGNVQVTVTAVNDTPVATDLPDQTIDEGSSFAVIDLDNYASDVDNSDAQLTWSYSGNQELSVSVSAEHNLSVTVPAENWFGAETITFRVTDPSGAFDEFTTLFTVNNVNDAPVAVDDQADTSEDAVLHIDVTGNDTDVEGDELHVSAVSQPAHGSTAIETDGRVLYTPSADWNGSDSFTYTVSDGNGGEDQGNVQVTVSAVNDAPVVSVIPGQNILEGETFSTFDLDDFASDVDNSDDQLNWNYSGNQALTVNIDAQHVVTIAMPSPDWNGKEIISFVAADPGLLSDSAAVTFKVSAINDAPAVTSVPNQTKDEGQPFDEINLNEFVADSDNTDAEITWQVSGNSRVTVQIDGQNLAVVTPVDPNWFGADTVQFRAEDPSGASDSCQTVFVVNPVNDAPEISGIPDFSVDEGQTFAAISLNDYVNDVDNADSSLVWSYSGNQALQISVSPDHIATIIIPDPDWQGSETVTFTVTDPSNADDSENVVFTVNPINDLPVAEPDSATIDEDMPILIAVLQNDTDPEDNALSVASVSQGAHGSASVHQDTLVSYQPQANWFGADSLMYAVSDGAGGLDSAWIFITVRAVNDKPLISSLTGQEVREGQPFPELNLDQFVSDPDDADSLLQWSVSGMKALLVSLEENILKVSAPDSNWNGSESLLFSVKDEEGLADSLSVAFTILAVNDSTRIIAGLPQLSFMEDDTLSLSKSAWYDYADDADNSDSTLQFSVKNGKQVWSSSKNGAFVFKSPANWFGKDSLQLKAGDGVTADSSWFIVQVNPVNDAPVIRNLPQLVSFYNDTTAILSMADFASDIDSPDSSLHWSFGTDSDSLLTRFEAKTGLLTLSAPGFTGQVSLICSLSDDFGLSASDTVLIEVKLPTGIENAELLPLQYSMDQNYPNPFNPTTTIKFAIPQAGRVRLVLYNILGRETAVIFDGSQPAGVHRIVFNATGLASGVYFCQMEANGFRQVRKMILMR